ncbi:hypothetical protein ACHAWT_003706 [Skeletonema menzelii]
MVIPRLQIILVIGLCVTVAVVDAFAPPIAATRHPTTSAHNMMPADVLQNTIMNLDHLNNSILTMDQAAAETLAGPFFGLSLFPYLAFLYFLDLPQNETPKGVTVGFATCLLFVFLTIPAAVGAKVWYGVSLADSDWLHGSAESLLTVTNLVTVIAFRQALSFKELEADGVGASMPESMVSYRPMINLVVVLTALAGVSAFVPGFMGAEVHTPYLNGFMDIPFQLSAKHPEPENALTVACWIIHISSLWRGLTWGLLPLHSSGITACTYHLFYNSIPALVPLQAMLTCLGNTTAMFAAYRIAISNGWSAPWGGILALNDDDNFKTNPQEEESQSLVGFEDLGDALATDNDWTFIAKLFAGCAVASYLVKYGELWLDFPFESELYLSLAFIFIPSLLNSFKWWKRSQDPTFDGWF